MAEFVGGAFLSATLQVAFEKLASRDIINYFRGRKIKDGLLNKLRITLNSINQVLEDAEEMQYRNQHVKRWLDELKDAVFKAEDLLDEIATEASRQKLKAELHPTTSKVRSFLTAFVNPFDKEIESRIQDLLDHLDFLAEQKDKLGLKEGSSSGTEGGMGRKLSKRLPTTSLVDESNMYGRNDDKEEIIQILLSRDISDNQLPVNVISITGMGGMGKTTLAQLVYNDKRVSDQFHLQAWVCISEDFNVVQVTKTILRALHCSIEDFDDLNQHQLQLKEKLTGKKFFLVLDDVWNENRTSWDVLQAPFYYGASGSKILVTTRNKKVTSVMRSTHVHLLKPLEDEYCWKLFEKHAFDGQQGGIDPNLISAGKKIVKKCGGSPLAIKTLGSLLYTEQSHQKWVKILESEIWHLSEDDSNIIPALRLSYHYLPSNLKRCFAYCSIFPKDYEIEKNFLISLWMAEGLLHSCQKDQSIEDIGNEYFNDLESRSFFEPVRSSGCFFIMHDLLNDLAKSVMGEFYLHLGGDMMHDIPIKARYISYLANECREYKTFDLIFKCNQLRNFMPLHQYHFVSTINSMNHDFVHDVLSRLGRLKCMRVLSLKRLDRFRLANICNLQHLRYLDLSHTQIKELPNSICSMINLQTLKLKGCRRLVKLPSNFYRLINLRHLDLEDAGIQKMPKYVGKLENLQKMTQFVVGKHRGSDMRELGKLNHLKDSLIISCLENIIDPTNAREANVKDKKYLNELEFDWGMIQDLDVSQSQRQERVLEALQPHSNLKELTVRGYAGTRFSNWFDGPYLPNLISLHMWECTSCINLPPLGQLPFLKDLRIDGFNGIKVIGQEFYGNDSSSAPFRSLLYLHFSDMKEWEKWNICYDGESFPRLRSLRIWNCPKLTRSLPQHLPLKILQIVGCENLETSLPKAIAMEELWLSRCKKISLKDMPTYSLTDVGNSRSSVDESSLLPPLRSLMLVDCPEMESLPQGGLLSSLRTLSIYRCPKVITSRKDWGLHELHSLEDVVVSDDFENVESFPEEGLLPANIQSLTFYHCLNLKTMNYRGLLHLQSLKSLTIGDCPSLSFEGLPEEGLPKSLSRLYIRGDCPLLKQRCQKDIGQDWPKVSHIPHVSIEPTLPI